MAKPHIVIISPYLANANNGNWQTAWRWSRFLSEKYKVTLALQWDGAACDAMIALHARRSATSIAAFAAAYPARPLIVVLTGTDLYRDINSDEAAQRSLQLATQLLILQTAGLQALNKNLHHKTQVIYQSAPALKPCKRNPEIQHRYFDVTMIGHLRDEKDPGTFMQAAKSVESVRVRMLHIGGALDPALAAQAENTQQLYSRYHWLGPVAHAATRQRLKRSQLMVITSKMEGGANVIIEAVTSGVPVLASDISGNRGMLDEDYAGYFPLGDSIKLAQLIDRAATDTKFYNRLQAQCAARAPLFAPERERTVLLKIVNSCITQKQGLS
jgi:putative glycosyltransferase (TIGR04348 family)